MKNKYIFNNKRQQKMNLINLIKEFIKMSSKYSKVEVHYIFNKNIAKLKSIGEKKKLNKYIVKLMSHY